MVSRMPCLGHTPPPPSPPTSLFPLLCTFLISAEQCFVAPILAFNAAVWRYRRPAQASRLVQTEGWLISRVVENARMVLRSIRAPKKKRKSFDVDSASLLHDEVLLSTGSDSFVCYTDGSASPNPGPCGAGASVFIRDPDTVCDIGASLGLGTNNFAELFALGAVLTHLLVLRARYPHVSRAVIFCDSKLALSAATSRNRIMTNIPVTTALRKAYLTLLQVLPVELHWVHGHANIGGNERVDVLSKSFASSPNNNDAREFDGFSGTVTCSPWVFGFPLTGLPIHCFKRDIVRV